MDYFTIIISFLSGLCWGSFLNVVSYRITFDKNFWQARSHCPHCNKLIAWHYNIPILSWCILKGKCATCKANISILYPLLELATGIIFATLAFVYLPDNYHLFFVYAFFTSALLCAMRSDLEAMVIPQLFTLYLIPFGVLSAWLGWSEINWIESIVAACLAYGFLWGIGTLFKRIRKQEGLGIGDAELLAMIGSFLGICKMWDTLMLGSTLGCIFTLLYLWYYNKGKETRIPFGPFLAIGALIVFCMR